MPDDAAVEIEVHVLRRDDWVLWCRIGEREVSIPASIIEAPRPLPLAGQRARVRVPGWFAKDHKLA